MLNKLKKKYVWLPLLIAVYAGCMAWFNRDAVTVRHEYASYYSTIAMEVIILIALSIFLKKRDELRRKREN